MAQTEALRQGGRYSGPKKMPKIAIAMLKTIMALRRPRSAIRAETGIAAATNSIPKSCSTRN